MKDPAVAQRIRERMRQDGDRTRPQVLPEKVVGGREREGRIGANDDRDQKGRDMSRDDRRPGPGMLPGGRRDESLTPPGGASQADIARRLEEEKKLREQRGGTAMDDRESKRNNDEDGRVGRLVGLLQPWLTVVRRNVATRWKLNNAGVPWKVMSLTRKRRWPTVIVWIKSVARR
ncbi:hypothetical protein [Verrucomicrobium spinosum]|uniref:hypothetical protein n=1 Tax=Verrucomicrobium spinosum TaxID=2736 RepID=UPI000A914B62|nr:hypothetical protein [Verrucomicrobium spinosum]